MDVSHDIDNSGNESPDPLAHPNPDLTSLSSNSHERWSKLPKPRGRQPRDPHGHSVRFHCRDADDMEVFLRNYLEAPTLPAEHATIEFIFPVTSAFMVAADLKNSKKSVTEGDKSPPLFTSQDKIALSIIDALASHTDSKEQMKKQKAIAKACIDTCEKADGFRYSFHNNWLSREDEACRFSYFCNDSMLNKGRAANEGAGMAGKKMRKPVYNCQGLIAVKFSVTKQNLEVHYKHVPLHKTYAERAPPPRRDSKRRKLMETSGTDISTPKESFEGSRAQNSMTPLAQMKRATDPIAGSEEVPAVDLTRDDSLRPLIEFLGSTNDGSASRDPLPNPIADAHEVPQSESPNSLSSNVTTAVDKTMTARTRRPAIPGTMTGSLQTGHLNWGTPALSSQALTRSVRKSKSRPAKSSISARTVSSRGKIDSTSIALSELEALKQKLEEAEQRIRRLESEKLTPAQPPQQALWPPPPNYAPTSSESQPYQAFGTQYSTQQIPPAPLRFQPPQQHRVAQEPNVNAHATTTHGINTSSATGRKQPASKTTKPKQVATKFVLYTPTVKSKQN